MLNGLLELELTRVLFDPTGSSGMAECVGTCNARSVMNDPIVLDDSVSSCPELRISITKFNPRHGTHYLN